VDQDHSVHILSFEHFFDDKGVELEFEKIPEIQGILEANDVSPETAFHFLENLLGEAGEGKPIVTTGVRGNNRVASGPGNDRKTVSPERRQSLGFKIVQAVIHGVEANASRLFEGIVYEPVVSEKSGGV
jgi:hypothetical protein